MKERSGCIDCLSILQNAENSRKMQITNKKTNNKNNETMGERQQVEREI